MCDGPFSETEAQQIKEAIIKYREVRTRPSVTSFPYITHDRRRILVRTRWMRLYSESCHAMGSGSISVRFVIVIRLLADQHAPARAVPQRRIRSVYDHVRRANHPSRNRGKWKELEDRRLKQ